jgi:hypothetical protein
MDLILVLLEHPESVRGNLGPLGVRDTYLCRDTKTLAGLWRDYLRRGFQAQRAFVLLKSDEVVYQAVRGFYEDKSRSLSTPGSTGMLDLNALT